MEKKFYYFGVRVKEVAIDGTGAPRKREAAIFAPRAYASYEEMAAAKADAERTRPGVSFFWQVYDRQLDIDATGHCKGFKA